MLYSVTMILVSLAACILMGRLMCEQNKNSLVAIVSAILFLANMLSIVLHVWKLLRI